MHKLDRTNLAEAAADVLRADIVAGRWALGERLPNETELCAVLQVSRGTLREAVRVLVAGGYLETRQGSGTYVRSLTSASDQLGRARRTSLRDQFEARCALDVEAARLAAVRQTPSVVAHLRDLLSRRGSSEDPDQEEFVRRDLAFHKAVVAAAGNKAMIEMYEFFSTSIADTIAATVNDEVPEPDLKAHVEIIDAIETGDPQKADAAIRSFMAPILAFLKDTE